MDRITAPYGFVPVNQKVVCPDWLQPRQIDNRWIAPPLHDVPFADGLCGQLDVEITAETPIFTRSATGDGSTFFQLPEGTFALPGTLLKGALRNVLEIATFGRLFDRVNDHRYAVRDLQNRDLYGQFMAEIVLNPRTNRREPMPLVNAGWLKKNKDAQTPYQIEVCDFARIEYLQLEELARQAGVRNFRPGQKQSSVAKYNAWGKAGREIRVDVRFQRPDQINGKPMPSRFGKVVTLQGKREGTLVFTGQPSRWTPDRTGQRRRGSPKHHDFVFFPPLTPRAIVVPERVFSDFEFAHSDEGQQHNLGRSETPNEEWAFWKKRLDEEQAVPVFFLLDEPQGRSRQELPSLRAFGLAMMFRLPYRYSIQDAVTHVQQEWAHNPKPRFDFADGLFGTVIPQQERREALALKSRVDISHARVVGQAPTPLPTQRMVLGAPKASYYPNYTEQIPGTPGSHPPRDNKGKARYTTWQDEGCRPRGWKRYRPQTETWQPAPPTGADGRQLSLDRVASQMKPLPANTRFRTQIYLHNLRLIELGALLWTLDFGGDANARHTLGLARPLGYGSCHFRLLSSESLRDVHNQPVDLEACRHEFLRYMEEQIPGWRQSQEIQELLALAQPVHPKEARYQRLDPGRRINEFVDAKKAGLALPSAHLGPQSPPGAFHSPGKGGRGRTQQGRGRAQQKGRPQQGRGRSSSPGTPPASPRSGGPRSGWPGMRRGDILTVRLTELNKKGKWRSTAIDYDARGTIEGTPPPDAEADKEYEVEVIQGSDPRNLNLKWRTSS